MITKDKTKHTQKLMVVQIKQPEGNKRSLTKAKQLCKGMNQYEK